jgi:ATP-dependent Lon protease
MKTVVLPKDNEKDLSEIPDDISRQLSFKLVSSMDEVLEIALEGPVSAVELRSESTEEIAGPTEDGPVTH